MALIKARFGDAPPLKQVGEGMYDLRIRNKELKQSRGGDDKPQRPMIECIIEVEGEGDCEPIWHYLVFPIDEDWEQREETAKILLRNARAFLRAFGVEETEDGFYDDDLDGATARLPVKLEKGGDGVERPRLVLPRVSE